ncbi:unnamed protein product [Gadus morhua 'NCC']
MHKYIFLSTAQVPTQPNGPILAYRLLWAELPSGKEQSVEVSGRSFKMEGLNKYSEYAVRVLALNRHGAGVSAETLRIATLSDVPSAPPQNVSLEVVLSRVCWQPPPPIFTEWSHHGSIRSVTIGPVAVVTRRPWSPTNYWYQFTDYAVADHRRLSALKRRPVARALIGPDAHATLVVTLRGGS